MTPIPNDGLLGNENQWDAGNFAPTQGQTTPEDPIPVTSNGMITSTMAAPPAAVAAATPLCSKTEPAAEEGMAPADFSFFPGAFYPGQWWAPNGPFTMDDQSWTAMNYNPFTNLGGQTMSHPYDPFPSTSMAGPSTPSTNAVSTAAQITYPYGMMTNNTGYWPAMSLPTTSVLATSANRRAHKPAGSSSNIPRNLPYKTGRGTNDVRVRTSDQYRRVYTDEIRIELEKEYHTNEFITAARKADLAEQLNLTERQIKIWFQNRRAKKRKEDPR